MFVVLLWFHTNKHEEAKMYKIIRATLASKGEKVRSWVQMATCKTKEEAESMVKNRPTSSDLLKYEYWVVGSTEIKGA